MTENKEEEEKVKIYDKDMYISQEKLRTIAIIIIIFIIGFLAGYFSNTFMNIDEEVKDKVNMNNAYETKDGELKIN